MILVLLPLTHFLFGSLSLLWRRLVRPLALLAWLGDGVLMGLLFFATASGKEPSVILGGWTQNIGIELAVDAFGLGFCVLTFFLAGAVLAYLWREQQSPYFYTLLHLLLGSVYALLFARDLFNIYVIMELLTLVSFLLIGYERRSEQIWAALKYLFLASLGMAIYLFGVALVYHHTGVLNLPLLAERISSQTQAPWIPLASSLLVAGVAVKAGIFFFSLWLPKAHACATPAVSALLSGLVIKMGVVVLYRLSAVFSLSTILLVLSVVTGFAGIIYAIYTYDLKRMLAFSTLSQIGYLLAGIATGSKTAQLGALLYALGHGLFKGLLFLAAGAATRQTGREDLPGLITQRSTLSPTIRGAFLVGTLAIMGMPPLAGFCAKAILSYEQPISSGIHIFLGLLSLGTVISFAKLLPLCAIRRGPPTPWPQRLSYLILILPIVLFVPLSWPFYPLPEWGGVLNVFHLLESLSIIGLGVVVYRLMARRPLRLPRRAFRLEEASLLLLSGFFLVFILSSLG